MNVMALAHSKLKGGLHSKRHTDRLCPEIRLSSLLITRDLIGLCVLSSCKYRVQYTLLLRAKTLDL